MCGIAGFSLSPWAQANANANALARNLLLGIEHRGKDATGAAWRTPVSTSIRSKDVEAKLFVLGLEIPRHGVNAAVLHTRFATQGSPKVPLNNHPINYQNVVGVHNGQVWNDDDIFRFLDAPRYGEVDSEAIFALLNQADVGDVKAYEKLLDEVWGTFAIGWLDHRSSKPGELFLARGNSSPLCLIKTKDGSTVFASTHWAARNACDVAGLTPSDAMEMEEGEGRVIVDGQVAGEFEFPVYGYAKSWSSTVQPITPAVTVHTPKDDSERYAAYWGEKTTSPPRYVSVETPVIRGWLDLDVFDAVEIGGGGWDESFRKLTETHPNRAVDIEDFLSSMADLYRKSEDENCKFPDDEAWNEGYERGMLLCIGDTVTTMFMGGKEKAIILEMPDEFPDGLYTLLVMPAFFGQEERCVIRRNAASIWRNA